MQLRYLPGALDPPPYLSDLNRGIQNVDDAVVWFVRLALEFWWIPMVMVFPYIVWNIWWTVWEGANISGKLGGWKWKPPSPGPLTPRWRKVVYRFIAWWQWWL